MTRDSTNNLSLFGEETLYSNRECLLFPTYAKRDPKDGKKWVIRAKGWALSHNSSTTKQKMMMGITKSVAGKSSVDRNSSQLFEDRFKYFLATNKRHVQFLIQAVGTTTLEESRKMTQHEQQFIYPPLFEDSLNMLSTRFNQLLTYDSITKKSSINQSISLPITPPTDDDEDDDEEEDWNSYDDPHLLPRPSNPISSVLDGNYFDINYNRKASTTSTTSSSSIDQPQEIEEGQVRLRTKGSGFLRGQFSIPHDHVLNWAQEQNQCDARLIKIQSVCIENNKFSPNHNVVSLIEPTGISIISDIDDTIKDTQIKAGARTVLSKTFFEPTKGVTGMADAYMSWYSQGASFHYVSNSPFQLMPMLDSFIRDSQFPPGSMHLRDDGKLIARLVETPGQAKREAILDILRDFPHRHFILIGDSGEIDLEIYTRIAIEYPEQILKIYIRDVTTPTRTELQQSMTSVRQKSSLSSLFYPKRRSQSEFIYKKKHRSPLGMRRAVTTMLAEYAVEPHLTGHRSTLHIDDTDEQNLDGLLDPLRFQKVSSVEACAQLYHRLEKARNRVAIDIILFQDPDTLRRDTEITNSLWDMWDDQSNLSDPL